MAQDDKTKTQKVLIIKDTAIAGKFTPRGEVITLDLSSAQDKENYGMLVHGGCVADVTDENVARLKAEVAADAKSLVQHRAAQQVTLETVSAAVAAAVVQTLIDNGVIKAPKS